MSRLPDAHLLILKPWDSNAMWLMSDAASFMVSTLYLRNECSIGWRACFAVRHSSTWGLGSQLFDSGIMSRSICSVTRSFAEAKVRSQEITARYKKECMM